MQIRDVVVALGCREIWSAISLHNIICSSRFIYGYGYNKILVATMVDKQSLHHHDHIIAKRMLTKVKFLLLILFSVGVFCIIYFSFLTFLGVCVQGFPWKMMGFAWSPQTSPSEHVYQLKTLSLLWKLYELS